MSAKDYDYLLKFLIVGDTGVGKSCLLLKFVEGSFSDTFISTIGVDFKIKTVTMNDRKVKLQIWDTAGQERYRSIVANFYRGAQGVMLVFDVTDINSFLKIQTWLEEIHRLSPDDVKILLVGTKKDMESKRMVDQKEGQAAAAKHNVEYVETSSKTGENVETAFMTLANLCYNVAVQKKPEEKVGVDVRTNENRGYCSC